MRGVITSVLLFIVVHANAQSLPYSVLATATIYHENSGYGLASVVGEMCLVETFQSGNYLLTQGFLQTLDQATHVQTISAKPRVWLLYPNPAKEKLYLKSKQEIYGSIQVEIKNSLGQTVIQKVFNPLPSIETILEIPIPNSCVGLYFIQVRTRNINKMEEGYSEKIYME